MRLAILITTLSIIGCAQPKSGQTIDLNSLDAAPLIDAFVLEDMTPIDIGIPGNDGRLVDVGMVILVDAALMDASFVPDMAMEPPALCAACQSSDDCAPGGICLTNQNTSEQFCGTACRLATDCPRGANCFELDDGSQQCVPDGATCSGFPPTDLGAICIDESDCQNGATHCVQAGDRTYCSVQCQDQADCPVGFTGCESGMCRADWTHGPEGCGRRADEALPTCGDDDECPNDSICISALLDSVPQTIQPFCTQVCLQDGDCPQSTTCQRVSDGISTCIPDECRCLVHPAHESPLDAAFELAGTNRCDAGFSQGVLGLLRPDIANDPFRLSFFTRAHQNAYGGLVWARQSKENLHAASTSRQPATDLLEIGATLLDQAVSNSQASEPTSAIEGARAIWGVAERPFPEMDVAAVFSALSPELDRAVGLILAAEADVVNARRLITLDTGMNDGFSESLFNVMRASLITQPDFGGINMRHEQLQMLLKGGFDTRKLFVAARDLATTIESTDWVPMMGTVGISVRIESPYGPIVINDARDHLLEVGETPLLLIDLGGDDRYEIPVGVTANWDRPVSVAIDLSGDDHYGFPGSTGPSTHPPLAPADEAGRYDGRHPQVGDQFGPFTLSTIPRQGTGIMGVGILYEFSGNDHYVSHSLSQGAGILGVGLLIDRAGNDRYTCEQGCQGAGAYGIGALVDGQGSDRYLSVQHTQGYGYVRGLGILHDAQGDDQYTALSGDPETGGIFLYPSAQNATSNSSFAQGAGFGRRADQTDQVFASGGLGVFVDAGDGNDAYSVDIFGQGTGYWFGTGIFSDGGGDDVYTGRWYTQGSSAHFAMGFFFEEGGDDQYNPNGSIIATAVGQGHDLSLGWLVDYGGNDRYWAPGLGLGGGNDNGIGCFADLGGVDTYDAPDGTTFGGANIGERGAAFDTALSLGVFIDSQGDDDYVQFDDMSLIGNARTWSWTDRREERRPGALGSGLDIEDPQFHLP